EDIIHCGSVLGPGGSFELEHDVGPCDGPGPAITVISASLDLNGHTVSCTDNGLLPPSWPNGIELWGKGSRLKDGGGFNCNIGVLVAGQGKHTVEKVASSGNHADGFHLDAPRNTIKDSGAFFNAEDGFHVDSARNRFNQTAAIGNGDDGYDLDEGAGE